jgi:deferrochelatase/peroxidase EfeB
MEVRLDNAHPLDPGAPASIRMLSRLQGNILKGHGRDHTACLLFRIGNAAAGRRVLARIASTYVTTGYRQLDESRNYAAAGIAGTLFVTLSLSARGYEALGFPRAEIEKAFPEPPGAGGIRSSWLRGMAAHGEELHDPEPSTWEEPYRAADLHGMLLLADDEASFLRYQVAAFTRALSRCGDVLHVEYGRAVRDARGRAVEPFGYACGISQPLFLEPDLRGVERGGGYDPFAPLGLALAPDPLGGEPESYGSYLVFRKLEQDVRRFRAGVEALADRIGLANSDRARAGAMAVGRFPDGVPLTASAHSGERPVNLNAFDYAQDADGTRCPFHAHVRKANPRGEVADQIDPALTAERAERIHRIVRRSVPYAPEGFHPHAPAAAPEALPSEGAGLLFMCYQAHIANQFAYIQSRWLNNANFVRGATGIDPIAGQAEGNGRGGLPQVWTTRWGTTSIEPVHFSGCVRLRGGEFFFTPSLPFLIGLDARSDLPS